MCQVNEIGFIMYYPCYIVVFILLRSRLQMHWFQIQPSSLWLLAIISKIVISNHHPSH